MSALTTRSPYLRNRLLLAVDGLRKDAEQARLNVAAADQDVAAARALLAEAEAQRRRARDELDGIETGIAWAQAHAATITREIDADPAAKLRATGLMRHEPKDIPVEQHTCANMGCTSCTGCDDCVCHDPAHSCLPWDESTRTECTGCLDAARAEVACTDDDLTAPGVADSRAQIAPHLPPPVPHDPAGVPVATHGPTVTMPDTGLNPDPLPPAPPTAEPRHAKPADRPGLLARLTGGHRTINDEQDGDADE